MRILRNIILLVFPLIIFVNLYQFIVVQSGTGLTYQYRGFHFLFEYFTTFNGLTHTLDTIAQIKSDVLSYAVSYTEITDLISFFVAFGNFFKLVGTVLSLPIWLLTDIVMDITWFIEMFMK